MVVIDNVNYLTVAEACALLGVKPATIYAYVSRDIFRSYKQGIKRQRLYRQDEVMALLAIRPGLEGTPQPERQPETPIVSQPDERLPREDQRDEELPNAEGWMGEV